MSDDRIAPKGAIWVCGACGKTAIDNHGGPGSDIGWDESCMLNATLCDEGSLIRQHGGMGARNKRQAIYRR